MKPHTHTDKLIGKWKVLIITSLHQTPLRFNKIKQVTGCNGNTLSQNLKQLEKSGIIVKTNGPYTRYRLTNDGVIISKLVKQLDEALSRLGH